MTSLLNKIGLSSKNISNFLNKLGFDSKWSTLTPVANSGLIKLTILMPLFGYLILFNETLIDHFELSKDYVFVYESNPESEFKITALIKYIFGSNSLRLYLFYYGLTFLSAGAIVYKFNCPVTYKKYSDLPSYISSILEVTNDSQLESYLHFISSADSTFEKYCTDCKNELQHLMKNNNGIYDIRLIHSPQFKIFAKDILRTAYQVGNKNKVRSINATFILFLLGFTILSIPTLIIFINVSWSIFN